MHVTAMPADPGKTAPSANRGPFFAEDVLWLIRLRWWALLGVLVVAGGCYFFQLIETVPQLLLITAVVGLANLLLWFIARSRLQEVAQASVEKAVMPQLVLDLVALAVFLHFAGGVENPFVMFFSFHMSIGAMFLRPRLAWTVGLGGGLVHASIVVGEYFEVVPHNHLAFAFHAAIHPDLHTRAAYVGGYLVAFSLMLAGVIYFVQTVAERTRRTEALRQQHERVALSRERLARIGEISAGVAHAIRNPLHGLVNCVALLRKKAPPDDDWIREKHELMAEGLQRIDRVTHRLLALSREAPLKPVLTDLGALSNDAIRFVEGRAQGRDIRLAVEQEPLPPFRLDADRFSEVLINLLENALDACPKGGTITLRAGKVGRIMPIVWIEIADTGPGIAQEHLEKIFDPFFTTKAVGSGLGLAIARQVVEEHGGRIEVDSRSGQGTTVRLEVPFDTGESL